MTLVRTACQSMPDLSRGRRPKGGLNSEPFEKASFRAKRSRISPIAEKLLP